MKKSPVALISIYFGDLPDPRSMRTRAHTLSNIISIALCACIAGADSWVEVEEFGNAKLEFLRTFLDLPADNEQSQAIPSHDTFGRVFAALDALALETRLLAWTAALMEDLAGEIVAIDGKAIRRSLDRRRGQDMLHVVSAWASHSGVVLGQVATDAKSNEITAMPVLIDQLELKGATVTTDAMGCQKEIARKIVAKEADYVLAVKENQPKLLADVKRIMDEARTPGDRHGCSMFETVEKGHGRIETRRTWSTCTQGRLWLDQQDEDWAGLQSVALVETQRTIDGQTTTQQRLYISNKEGLGKHAAQHIGQAVRQHWGIENGLHWVLDVAFGEDQCRARIDNAARNLAALRKVALNVIKRDTKSKVGIATRRHRAGWDNDYLLKLLAGAI